MAMDKALVEQIKALGVAVDAAKQKRAEVYKEYTHIGTEIELMMQALTGLLRQEFERSGEVPSVGWMTPSGKPATITLDKTDIPTVVDWDSVYRHILDTQSFDLIYKRINLTAVRERWEASEEVPGVNHFEKYEAKVSVPKQSKAKAKGK